MNQSSESTFIEKFQKSHLTDRYLFQHTFDTEPLVQGLIEAALKIKVKGITFAKDEVTYTNAIGRKDIRCDVIVTDITNTVYNIEMENRDRNIHERREYYTAMLAVDSVKKGGKYTELAWRKIIIITNFDPFGKNAVIYTLEEKCREFPEIDTRARSETTFINLKGTVGLDTITPELRDFIKLSQNTTQEVADTLETKFGRDIFERVLYIKNDEKEEKRYMGFMLDYQDDMMESEAKGKAAGEKIGEDKGVSKTIDIINSLKSGMTPASIAEKVGMPIDKVNEIVEAIR